MAQGNVEIWLGKLLTMSLRSVHAVNRNAIVAIRDPNFEVLEFLNSYPSQVNKLMNAALDDDDTKFSCKYTHPYSHSY